MSEEIERLKAFIGYQRIFWKQLKSGKIPPKETINIWIESCDDALDDINKIEGMIK